MKKVSFPDIEKGEWKIRNRVVDKVDFGAMLVGRGIPLGEKITVLYRNGTVVMSDTPAEIRDHWLPVDKAEGSCLINGLGIGLVLKNILLKKSVTDITVIEISQDLLDLVSPYYKDDRITFICADAMTWNPPKGKKYGMVWHDIWDTICADNLEDMKKLHRKYGRKSIWQGSWCRAECEYEKRGGY